MKVLESWRDYPGSTDAIGVREDVIGKICEVDDVSNYSVQVHPCDENNIWTMVVPYSVLCPAEVFEDEPKETINIGGTEYEVTDELKEALAKLKRIK